MKGKSCVVAAAWSTTATAGGVERGAAPDGQPGRPQGVSAGCTARPPLLVSDRERSDDNGIRRASSGMTRLAAACDGSGTGRLEFA